MAEAKKVLRVAGIALLVIFVLIVGIPTVLALAGVALSLIAFMFGLAVLLTKIAIFVAIVYLVLVGVRALLR